MTSYTPNKNYAQPTVGGDANTWGSSLNTNAGIVDNNLGGIVSIDAAGNSNITPTSAQAQNLVQRLTGALTGDIEYILPAAGTLVVIDNQTSGAFTVTVITSASGSVGTIAPQGSALLVYSDGTNVYPADRSRANEIIAPSLSVSGAADLAGNVTVSGTLTAGGLLSVSLGVEQTVVTISTSGTTQGTAAAIGSAAAAHITGGTGGAILFSGWPAGAMTFVRNDSGATASIYPPVGQTFAGLVLNNPYNMTTGSSQIFINLGGNTWAVL